MSLFNNFFRKNKKQKQDDGPMPTRGLNLQFPLTPDNGPNFAQQFVIAVEQNENIRLDYSVDSLDFVDIFLQRFRDEGLSVNDFAETIFVAGSYVGQVMVANNNGIWIKEEDVNLPDGITMMPIIIKLPNETIADPIAKAFKRFYNGKADNIKYFYSVFTNK